MERTNETESMIWKKIVIKRIRRNLEKNRPGNPSNKMLVLFNPDFPVDKPFLDRLAKPLQIPVLNIRTLIFEKVPKNPDFTSVTEKSFGFFGQIKDENLKKILDQPYDIFIDLTKLSNLHEQLLSSYVKSRFRIGITDSLPEFYDLMLQVESREQLTENLLTFWQRLQFSK